MKVSFICPIRNKAAYVEKAVRSILNQSYSPMEIVLSDQGSTDGSLDIVRKLADEYDGPNRVRILSCEDTSYTGMAGLNRHFNYIDTQIEGDIVISCSADDFVHPDRALHTVRAFEEFDPSYVNTGVCYTAENGDVLHNTDFPNRASRWLTPEETIRYQIGSAGSSAWARDLYQKHGPLEGCEQQDMILPMMALIERGIYYVDEVDHTYIAHASLENTGLCGQMGAAQDETHYTQLVELNNFINVLNWTATIGRWQSNPNRFEQLIGDPRILNALMEKINLCSYAWASIRNKMIMERITPLQMNV
jgi:glycosyltransferase involved in cell wall biosynthesis